MSTFSEQFSAARKSTVEAQLEYLRNLGQTAVDSTEKVLALNLNAGRSTLEKSSAAARQLLEVKSPADLGPFTSHAQDSFNSLMAYGRELFSIASAVQAELLKPAPQVPAAAAKVFSALPLGNPVTQATEAFAAAAASATRLATGAAAATQDGAKSAADYTADAARAAAQTLAEETADSAQQAGRLIESAGHTLADAAASAFGFGRPTTAAADFDSASQEGSAAEPDPSVNSAKFDAPPSPAPQSSAVVVEPAGTRDASGTQAVQADASITAQAPSGTTPAPEARAVSNDSASAAPVQADTPASPAASVTEELVEQVAELQGKVVEAAPEVPAPEPVAKPKPVAKAIAKAAKQVGAKPVAAEIPSIDVRQVKVNGLKLDNEGAAGSSQTQLDLPSPKGGRSRK